jgi:hypothetical protein
VWLTLVTSDLTPTKNAGLSPVESDLLLARYNALTQQGLEMTGRQFTVIREFVALTVAIFAAAFFVKADTVSLGAFMFVFGACVPWFGLVGLLMVMWYFYSATTALHQSHLMSEFYPSVQWPPHIVDLRALNLVPGQRNRHGAFAAAVTFIGMSVASIVLALLRSEQWPASLHRGEASSIAIGVLAVCAEAGVLVNAFARLSALSNQSVTRAQNRSDGINTSGSERDIEPNRTTS